MNQSTWDKKPITGYLVDMVNRERLEFQFNPSVITDEKSTNYAAIHIPGMSHPRYQYISGEARRITFTLELFKGSVKSKVDWLRSLQYPEHSGTALKHAPHKILFFFGDLYPGITCIVRSVKVRYFNLFDRDKLLPQHAEIDLTLDEVVDASIKWKEVRK